MKGRYNSEERISAKGWKLYFKNKEMKILELESIISEMKMIIRRAQH